jgi:predicted metal-binding protein
MRDRGPIPQRIAKVDPIAAATTLAGDSERYVQLAMQSGATAAEVIDPAQIVIDERVTMKCAVPKCFGYGTCANCPPHAPRPEEVRRVVERFSKGVVVRLDVPPEVIVRDRATLDERLAAYVTMFHIVSAVESAAFYDGHYLAVGFAAGGCKSTLCHSEECAVLAREKCRHDLMARPSMEAVGMDCFAMAAALGWDMYPVGISAPADCIPVSSLMGVVLVG